MEKMHFDGHLIDIALWTPNVMSLRESAMKRKVSMCASDSSMIDVNKACERHIQVRRQHVGPSAICMPRLFDSCK